MSVGLAASQGFQDASRDAFSRLRVSNPTGIWDAQFTYALKPLRFEAVTNGTGATVAHDSTNRCALMTFSSTATGGKAFMQSYEFIRYQPGKSQLAFLTFNFIEAKANCLKFAGLSDGSNGIEFQLSGSTRQFVLYSDTGNGDQTVTQGNWNLDRLDGTGPSGVNLDITKVQILVIDFQALYVGRVRVGFDIDGQIIYVHEFLHANRITTPYIQYANLPVRCGMTCSGTVSSTMRFICCSVSSEGGFQDVEGLQFSTIATATAGNGSDVHILSIQPKTTYNSLTNRIKFVLEQVDVMVTGNSPVIWKALIGQALSGSSATDVNSQSGFETLTGTLSGSPTVVLANGLVPATNQTKSSVRDSLNHHYPITLDAAGAVRVNGRLSFSVQGIGGTSVTYLTAQWREIR